MDPFPPETPMFAKHALGSLVKERDVVLDVVLKLHHQLQALEDQLTGSEGGVAFQDDLCVFLDKYFALRLGSAKLEWKHYYKTLSATPLPPLFSPPYAENLLDASVRLDFVYDTRREHVALSSLLACADALHARAEMLRELSLQQPSGLDDIQRDVRTNEGACLLLADVALWFAEAASHYEAFATRICSRDLSIPERDACFAKVRFGYEKVTKVFTRVERLGWGVGVGGCERDEERKRDRDRESMGVCVCVYVCVCVCVCACVYVCVCACVLLC